MPKKPSSPLRSLARGLLRASWHKQNLYNFFKKEAYRRSASLYQQKWESKRETRAYHGDHITENNWLGVFKKNLVGAETLHDKDDKSGEREPVPIALQLYAPIERRLDMAMFRAMFASSPRQAREFISSGKVKVNGSKVKHGFYPLRPGDVFSVEPECVLTAVGREKPSEGFSKEVDTKQLEAFEKFKENCKEDPRNMFEQKFTPISVDGPYDPERLYQKVRAMTVENLMNKIQDLTLDGVSAEDLVAKGQMEVEQYRDSFQAGEAVTADDPSISQLATEYFRLDSTASEPSAEAKDLLKRIAQRRVEIQQTELQEFVRLFRGAASVYDPRWYYPYLEEYCGSPLPWQDGAYGLQDPSKPYFTPWTPRTFLAPFAIVPWHLEISYKTCHAVYLRDPITRRGHSEVISPLPLYMHENAYLFYVRDRQ
ncbi:hypothetical protein POJ06DRAFT_237294 [Lipomyces tetrasporus]|uniref:RNA-binding S4 domain-containing protein n=1 Tax=Lipomyces tetrasporus TaxID=54092 RepID=A0AAD7QTP9_9ASCO|nr:uncharacterized protein POJ06DRAFT_237294 [Lipomyces tetrasporus]KAJ8101144.1 hypothetical protein POJ06DRAFT_237294 [Lipomyces tetrasporus]